MFFLPSVSRAADIPTSEAEFVERHVIERAKDALLDPARFAAVARCESGFSYNAIHFNRNGTVDRGVFQINSIHDPLMRQFGLNPYSYSDNVSFAVWLVKTSGWGVFAASRACWSKPSILALDG